MSTSHLFMTTQLGEGECELITGTIPRDYSEVKCLAQGHDGDGS